MRMKQNKKATTLIGYLLNDMYNDSSAFDWVESYE